MKVEVGQEWHRLTGSHAIIKEIKRVDNCNKAISFTLPNCLTDTGMLLKDDGDPLYSGYWTYVGRPTPCEDCYEFCGQSCKYRECK